MLLLGRPNGVTCHLKTDNIYVVNDRLYVTHFLIHVSQRYVWIKADAVSIHR
jgi:hypothetical protein